MSSRLFLLLPFLGFAASMARAETSPATGDPVRLDPFVTTASPLARAADEIAQPTSVLGGTQLAHQLQATLGETLSGLAGVDSTSFGPGASRPVIRGLGGDRIRVLTGGIGTLDASVVSPDHAVSLEPLLIERIEVVRGPASLLYGGGAIGGVVNVIDGRIPEERPGAPAIGRFELRGNSVAAERAAAGVVTGASGPLAWRIDGFRRETDDAKIPGLAPTSARAQAMLADGETPADGRLPNSATRTTGGAAGLSYIGESGHLGAAYSGFDSLYGIVAEPDVRIDLRQRRIDAHGEWLQPAGLLRAAKLQLGIADYRHDELEGEELGTRFTNRGYEGRFELLHEKIGPLEGAVGLQASRSDFSAVGEEAFLPPTITENRALFVYEEVARGAVSWQLGGRAEWQKITPDATAGIGVRRHSFATFTGGAVWKPGDNWVLTASVSANERAPNAQELFADGPHAGTGTYERGAPALSAEKSTGFDVGLRRRKGFVTGEVSLFLNRFDGYIFEAATGDEEDGLPVFAFAQRDAEFYGGEVEVVFHLVERTESTANLRLVADTVRATNMTDRTPLPRITPVRLGVAFDRRSGPWSFTAELRDVASQRRIAPTETETDGYRMLNVSVTRRVDLGRTKAELFVRGNNLLNETARVHASFLKDIAPLPGRDVTAGVRLAF